MPKGVYKRTEYHSKRISEGSKGISKPERICLNCGNSFIPAHNDFIYCSRKCAGDARKGISFLSEEGRESLRRIFTKHPKDSRSCLECGKEFIGTIDQKFCSISCSSKYWWKHRDNSERCNKIGEALSVEKLLIVCKYCGKEFFVHPCFVNTQYCSLECFGLDHRGPNCVAWKGGIQFDPYPFEFNKDLKERIRNRDGNICQLCGKTKEQELKETEQNLPVHHINSVKEDCGEENLITLCCSCHNKTKHNREYWENYFQEVLLNRRILV